MPCGRHRERGWIRDRHGIRHWQCQESRPALEGFAADDLRCLGHQPVGLEHSLAGLAAQHPATQMSGICCDYSQLQGLPTHPWLTGERRIGFFPGSSLGNFTPKDAVHLLQQFRQLLAGGPLLLGLDQPSDPALLEAAYDDAAGVSRAFAFNLLKRLNRDLQGNAEPNNFRYEARWQADQQRIEMALVSRCSQTIQLAESAWSFSPNER